MSESFDVEVRRGSALAARRKWTTAPVVYRGGYPLRAGRPRRHFEARDRMDTPRAHTL